LLEARCPCLVPNTVTTRDDHYFVFLSNTEMSDIFGPKNENVIYAVFDTE